MNVLSIPSRGRLAPASTLLTLCFAQAVGIAGCGSTHPEDAPGRLQAEGRVGTAVTTTRWDACPLAGLDAAVTALATPDGIAVASAAAGSQDAGAVVVRYRGLGCALAPAGTPLAVYELLDADAPGNLYAFPAAAAPGAASTLPPGEHTPARDGMVVRISPAGQATQVVQAGRGIWMFGASAAGGAFWSTACGPTGIFAMASEPPRSVLSPPETSWQWAGAVLTADSTLWSLASPGCGTGSPDGPPCVRPLVRTTPAGDRAVGTIAIDIAADSGRAALFRCGERLCGVASQTITLWGDDGAALRTAGKDELGLRAGEQIVRASSNPHGIYVLTRSPDGQRLLFNPTHG